MLIYFKACQPLFRTRKKGVMTKGSFSLEESPESLKCLNSLNYGRILLVSPTLWGLSRINSLESRHHFPWFCKCFPLKMNGSRRSNSLLFYRRSVFSTVGSFGQGNLKKKQGFFSAPNPQNPWKRKDKSPKSKESCKRKKARKSPKKERGIKESFKAICRNNLTRLKITSGA